MALSSTPASGGRSLSRVASPLRLSPSVSPVSPARLSRLQEKEELQQLNDRLAAYIERVRALEAEKSALHQWLAAQEAESDRQLGSLRLCYERELADARRTLDQVAIQRATLQVELDKIGEEHRELHIRSVPRSCRRICGAPSRPRCWEPPWGWLLYGALAGREEGGSVACW